MKPADPTSGLRPALSEVLFYASAPKTGSTLMSRMFWKVLAANDVGFHRHHIGKEANRSRQRSPDEQVNYYVDH